MISGILNYGNVIIMVILDPDTGEYTFNVAIGENDYSVTGTLGE